MAVYYYTYSGSANGTVNIGQQYYTDPGFVNYAFTIGSAINHNNDYLSPNKRVHFNVSAGSALEDTYYCSSFGIVLTVVGDLVSVLVTDLNDDAISGIGTFVYGRNTPSVLCYYETSNTGTLIPSKSGYDFSPTSIVVSSAPAVVDKFTASVNPYPGKPINPLPANDATEVDFSGLGLSWTDGGNTDTYNVYMGPSGSLSLISSAQAGTSLTVDIADVPDNQVIYWRVDATNDAGTTTGDEWNFDARPAQVSTFVPADEASGIALHSTAGTWESPSDNTDSYNIYYGTLSGFLSLLGNTTDLTYTLRATNWPSYGAVHYWRVDAVNDFGVTQGNELYFTNLIYYPPLPSYDLINGSGDGPLDGGEEGVDYVWTGENNIITVKRIVTVSRNNKVFFEGI